MFPYFFYHTWKFLACSLIKFNNQIFPPCSFIPKSVILDLEKKSSLLIYSSLLVYEFSKKCQSACLFWSTRLLGTSEYFGTRALMSLVTEDGRSMTTFFYCSINHQSGLQKTHFQNYHIFL